MAFQSLHETLRHSQGTIQYLPPILSKKADGLQT